MKILGIALILGSILFTTYWVIIKDSNKAWLVSICLIAVFAGLALVFNERTTELTVKGVGTIKAAAIKAETDAEAISETKERVENQRAIIDLVAKEASEAKFISEETASKNKLAEEKLKIISISIKEAKSTIDELNLVSEYTMTVLKAQSDDRNAFDKLKEISQDANNPFSSNAEQAWITILESHSKSFFIINKKYPWNENIDPSELTLIELSQLYNKTPNYLKTNLIEYIWKREDIPKFERLEFLIRVIKNDSSLTAVEYAGRYFQTESGQKVKPLAVEIFVNWWENNRDSFKEKENS